MMCPPSFSISAHCISYPSITWAIFAPGGRKDFGRPRRISLDAAAGSRQVDARHRSELQLLDVDPAPLAPALQPGLRQLHPPGPGLEVPRKLRHLARDMPQEQLPLRA